MNDKAGEQLWVQAIVTLCDFFDAMVVNRSQSGAMVSE